MSKTFTAVVAGGGAVTWSPASVPAAQGSVSISGNTLTYTAPANTATNVNLTFTATAGGQSGAGSVQVTALGIGLTDVRRLNQPPLSAPYATNLGTPLLLTATISGLAPGANASVSWQVVNGMPTVASLSPAQVLSGTATTFTPSATLGGTVTLPLDNAR